MQGSLWEGEKNRFYGWTMVRWGQQWGDQVWGRWGRGRECEERHLKLMDIWGWYGNLV